MKGVLIMGEDKYSDLIKMRDDRYVMKDSCANRHEKLDGKIDDIRTEQTRIITKLDISNKVEWAIVAGVIGSFVVAVMNLILK